MRQNHPKQNRLSAFTLLEVILALAILAGSVAVLSEVMSLASRNASDAQAEAEAQLLAASVMDELLSGSLELVPASQQSIESDSATTWVYSVELADTTLVGLTSIEVIVEQDIEEQFRPVKFRLVRWFDESTLPDSVDDQQADEAEGGEDA